MDAEGRDLIIGCARRSPSRSPGDKGSIPFTSTNAVRTDRRYATSSDPVMPWLAWNLQ